MAKVSSKIRREKQFTRVYGIKVSKTVLTRAMKGDYSTNALIKNILKYNPKLNKRYADPNKALHAIINSGRATNTSEFLNVLKGELRSRTFMSQDWILKSSIPEIIEAALSDDEIATLKATLNVEDLSQAFWNFRWDSKEGKLYSPDGKFWIKVQKSNANGDYDEDSIEYGTV